MTISMTHTRAGLSVLRITRLLFGLLVAAMLAELAFADAILPVPRPVKGAQELPQQPVAPVDSTIPVGHTDMRNQASRALKQAKVNSMRMGMSYLLQNKAVQGVKTLKSGVQYRIITPGDGPKPGKSDTVEVNYSARLVDGTVYAASTVGQPAAMRIPSVVPGLAQTLRRMKTGARWEIVIPPDQGYGDTGALPTIPPGAVLIYDVELVSVRSEGGTPANRGEVEGKANDTAAPAE